MLVVPTEKHSRFFSNSFQILFSTNLCCHDKLQDKGITWLCLFGIITWRLWKNRNLFIFQNINWTAYEIIKTSLSWAQHFEPFLIGVQSIASNSKIRHHLVDNWVHLLSDGVVARDTGNASAGGVVR
ncbi:hypothetical protein PVK06_015020 [Gossypium arboreum]|uniref:Uncharacterized protein n=1 Tax=Gossypium arboreum TaxID=29729 RepID=A0ABR0PW19_GOSAR|nr:hypothetical protein PVK06_015020 [Gossypium arboreum]